MSRRPNVGAAMREAGGGARSARRVAEEASPAGPEPVRAVATRAITGHFAPEVRAALKILAVEQDRTMEDMLAEALNMVFAAYGKPEIAASGARASRAADAARSGAEAA